MKTERLNGQSNTCVRTHKSLNKTNKTHTLTQTHHEPIQPKPNNIGRVANVVACSSVQTFNIQCYIFDIPHAQALLRRGLCIAAYKMIQNDCCVNFVDSVRWTDFGAVRFGRVRQYMFHVRLKPG